jgi:hypothetical protein
VSIIDPTDHAEVRRDLALANRLIATILATFTEHDTQQNTRSVWVEDHVVAEWRAIAAAAQGVSA